MADFTNPVDSPTEWVAGHIKKYVETDGEEGHVWNGVPTLLLTTIGRKSGQARRSALIYGKDGDRYVIVGSRGGAPTHPQWFLNLRDNPEVELQVGAERFRARAQITSGEERQRLFEMMAGVFPNYREYAEKTAREIPVVVLERV
jgi:deazaflavin-dependent oxidoreductase (nitroreductase family)